MRVRRNERGCVTNIYPLGNDDLRGLVMRGVDLHDSRFFRQDLTGCDGFKIYASGAIFEKCCFRNAKLRFAVLLRTDLRGSDFTGADLTSARLCMADLRGCNFTNANLYCADLGDAITDETTIFTGANMDGCCQRPLGGRRFRENARQWTDKRRKHPKHFHPDLFKAVRKMQEDLGQIPTPHLNSE